MNKKSEQNQAPGGTRRFALLIIDMINDFAFPNAELLFKHAVPAARQIAKLKQAALDANVPVIYVNDNFKQWHDSFETTIEMVESKSEMGRAIVSILRPSRDDYYILKPHRSGFYKTPLGVLLDRLQVSNLIITGITTDMCVLFTSNDAHMRGYGIIVPSDCTAAVKDDYHRQALNILERSTDANIRHSSGIDLSSPESSKGETSSEA
jgi:nicotinamidase-related amidase